MTCSKVSGLELNLGSRVKTKYALFIVCLYTLCALRWRIRVSHMFAILSLLSCKQLAWKEMTSTHHCLHPVCVHLFLTSFLLATRLATMSWIIPRLLPSVDMDLRSVSMASWLVFPSSDSPLTAINWSFTRSRPSCWSTRNHTSDKSTNKQTIKLVYLLVLTFFSLGPDQRLRPLHWVDLILLVWHCAVILWFWFSQLKRQLPNEHREWEATGRT